MGEKFVDKYEIIETLGTGSMGVVYKAVDPEIGRTIAIKTLRSMYLGSDEAGSEALNRFKQESRSAGKLQHPNIVTIYSAGRTATGSPYIVMEYIQGESLEHKIKQGPLNPVEAIHYLAQIGSAIDYAHSENIIHRDIKPSNVIVDRYTHPHLLDFGVAKLSDTSLTPAGTVVGTPSYMSPEQIRGETLDSKSDIFAFAVLAYELFTGKRPFPGKDFTTVVSNIIHKEPLTFEAVGAMLPAELEAALAAGLSKDKTLRPASCAAFVESLAAVYNVEVDATGLVGGFSPSIAERVLAAMPAELAADDKERGVEEDIDALLGLTPEMSSVTDTAVEEVRAAETHIGTTAVSERPEVQASSRGGRRVALIVGGVIAAVLVVLASSKSGEEIEVAEVEDEQTNVQTVATAEDTVQPEVIEEPEQVPVAEEEPTVTDEVAVIVEAALPTVVLPATGVTSDFVAQLSPEELISLSRNATLTDKELATVLQAMGARPEGRFLPEVLRLTAHPQYLVRVQALKVMDRTEYQNETSFSTVENMLRNDKEFIVRGFAAKVLVQINAAAGRSVLEDHLAVESNNVVRKVIRKQLAE